MTKQFEGNEDWTKRKDGRIPSKGAMAAERASAGLGTSDDEPDLLASPSRPPIAWPKPSQREPRNPRS